MTSYVVDASVVAEWLVQGTYSANADVLFEGGLRGDLFIVPAICLVECTNVLWKEVRFRGMPPAATKDALTNLRALQLRHTPVKRLLDPALAVALKHNLVVYDSLYIALALRTNAQLVTLDAKQMRAATAEGITVKPVTDFKP